MPLFGGLSEIEVFAIFVMILTFVTLILFLDMLKAQKRARSYSDKLDEAWIASLARYVREHGLENGAVGSENVRTNRGALYIGSDAIHYLYRTQSLAKYLTKADFEQVCETLKQHQPMALVIPFDQILWYKCDQEDHRKSSVTIHFSSRYKENEHSFANAELYRRLVRIIPEKDVTNRSSHSL